MLKRILSLFIILAMALAPLTALATEAEAVVDPILLVDMNTDVLYVVLGGFAGLPLVSEATLYYLGSFAVLFVLGIVGSTSLVKNTANRLADSQKTGSVVAILEPLVLILLLMVCTGYLVDGAFSPFLYFRF